MDTPSPKHCPSCGTVLGQDADGLADGLCPRCLLASSLAAGHGFTKHFEAMALATLNMVTVHVFGHRDDFYFLLMESVDGPNLRSLLVDHRLSPDEALAIVPPLCEALEFAHRRNVVHCDIKPEWPAAGKEEELHHLRPFLDGNSSHGELTRLAERSGINENTLRSQLHPLRRAFRRHLRTKIAPTVSATEDTSSELHTLIDSPRPA